MSSTVKLAEIVTIAGDILRLQEMMDTEENPREWKKVKEALPLMKERFDKQRAIYTDMLLNDHPGEDAVEIASQELSSIKEKGHASWGPATEYTIEHLMPYLSKEAKKSPGYRKALKVMPLALAAACVIAYFVVRLFSQVDISAPIGTKEGLVQRAAAMEKFVRHDDFMHTRVRKGGWIKGLMFWPIEPTDDEMKGASEFAGLTLQAYEILRENDQICGDLTIGLGETLSKDEIKDVGRVAEFVRSDRMKWSDEPELDISVPLRTLHPCD